MNGIDSIHMNSGVYRCQDDIKNFQLRVILRKLIGPIPINCGPIKCASEREDVTIAWQQKLLSKRDFQRYVKRRNCRTELEKGYHDVIKTSTEKPYRLFTYVHENDFCDNIQNITTDTMSQMSKLEQEMSKLTLDRSTMNASKTQNVDESRSVFNEYIDFDLSKALDSSIVNVHTKNPYEYMIVMADLGNLDNESQLWHHYEQMICVIKYDRVKKIFAIFPDFSKTPNVPYVLQTEVDRKVYFYFTLENVSNVQLSTTEIHDSPALEKIIDTRFNNPVFNADFLCPAYDVYRAHLSIEILSAKNFGTNPIFVQYNIDLPKYWSSIGCLDTCGTTQSCKVYGGEKLAYFAYNFDIHLEYTVNGHEEDLPKCPTIYLQVISEDFWDRYTVEGLTYKSLPVYSPGSYTIELQCLNVPDNSHSENVRKYFLGDYGNLNDLTWLSIPKGHKGNALNKYGVPTIGTGSIQMRMNVLSQTNANGIFNSVMSADNHRDNGAVKKKKKRRPSLNKSINDIIDAYNNAKRAMLKFRLMLDKIDGEDDLDDLDE